MIFIAGISIALFISALLLMKKDKSKADLFLCFWMILNAVQLSFFYLLLSGAIYEYPNLLGLQFPLPLLHGVLLYYYVSSVTDQFPKNKVVIYLHLLPTIIAYAYLIPFFLLPADQKIEIFQNEGIGYEAFLQILNIAVFLSGIIYVVFSSLLLRKHKKKIRDQFSNIEEINLKWLQLLIYGLGVIWMIIIFTRDDTTIFVGVSIFVILVGFFGVQQKNIFNNNDSERQIKGKETNKEKYAKSGLTEDLSQKLYIDLTNLIKNDAIYRQQELSIGELADKLQTHPNYLSQVINEKTGKSFYDFINSFRVEDFKKLIAEPKNRKFTLLALAYESGFNSKSSFNRYFKKATGQTPSQYLNNLP